MEPQPLFKTESPGFMPAVRPLVWAVIGCVVVVMLFSPAGIIYKHADLSFMVAPFICYFVFRFFSKISLAYLPGYKTQQLAELISTICTGLAFALFLFFFLHNVQQLTNISLFNHIKGFLASLSGTAAWTVLFIAGVTFTRIAEIYRKDGEEKFLHPVFNALGQFFIGIGAWQFLAAFSGPKDVFSKIGLVVFSGMLVLAVSNIGHYGKNSKNPFIADASHWLTHSWTVKFLIGAFIATYILFIRPLYANAFKYAPIVEWLIVCFIGWRLFSGIKNGIRSRSAVDVHEVDWQKHIQFINNLQGADFPHLREIQESFTEYGSRDALLIYLTLLLHNNKIAPEEITRVLHPLINHHDLKMPWFAFGWEQRHVMKQNENKRRLVLGEIMTNLKYILDPANRTIEEHAYEQNQPG
jgi:hypothetical protein